MTKLDKFALPGRVDDLEDAGARAALDERWQKFVTGEFDDLPQFTQFYNPVAADTPADAQHRPIPWFAFPARLNREFTSDAERNRFADESRDQQDEYCEWSVRHNPDKSIARVTFTTEVREYYEQLWKVDRNAVLALYHEHVADDVELGELGVDDTYNPNNSRNNQVDGPIMHLRQGSNNLHAAIVLAAEATVLRTRDGVRVTDQQDLVACGELGNRFRGSDPQIASEVNGLAATGALLTLEDPLGIYLDGLMPEGIVFPPGVTMEDCWTVDRGTPGHAVRAHFEVPAGKGTVSDVTIGGVPVTSGAQLAHQVGIRLGAVAHSIGSQTPIERECGEPV